LDQKIVLGFREIATQPSSDFLRRNGAAFAEQAY
jgi:hypothetical protein